MEGLLGTGLNDRQANWMGRQHFTLTPESLAIDPPIPSRILHSLWLLNTQLDQIGMHAPMACNCY